jgi:hypothetical protein
MYVHTYVHDEDEVMVIMTATMVVWNFGAVFAVQYKHLFKLDVPHDTAVHP